MSATKPDDADARRSAQLEIQDGKAVWGSEWDSSAGIMDMLQGAYKRGWYARNREQQNGA